MTRKQGNGVDGVTSGQVNKGTSGQVNEWTGEQVNCGGRQNNRGTGVKTYDIWDEKGLKKARE